MRTGLVYDDIFLKHSTGMHPENADRLKAINGALADYGILDKLIPIDAEVVSTQMLETVHDPIYISGVKAFAAEGGGNMDPDTVVSPESYNAAVKAAGGACAAVKAVMEGQTDNSFVMVRPPGHHAEKDRSMGFCLFNNVAVAANYALLQFSCEKVMIIDWDVHHGNGTQKAFYDTDKVLYYSTHQQGIFPGTGKVNEVGTGAGEGFNINVPLTKGTGDTGLYYAYKNICAPVIKQYNPDLILISCGLDAHYSDPLAGLQATIQGFQQISDIILEAAEEVCHSRVVAVLEGGYNLGNVGHCAAAVISRMAGIDIGVEEPGEAPTHTTGPTMRMPIEGAIDVHKKYWSLL